VSVSDPAFSLRDTVLPGLRRYWRGPTWINAAWLLWLGLVRLGYKDQASELAGRLARAILANRLREYYHSYSGRGMGAREFAWSALAIELTEPDPAAGASYLPPLAYTASLPLRHGNTTTD
jgi:glycogen debranching enzyme